ncbi:MAG: histidinol dehydrogenase, partial [Epsilonproteobacteria bacterium]|nr:histidinol dehydrogenase [Campylobacterota bacterium]
SPLSVEHFLKKSSIISMSRKGLEEIGRECALIANIEGLHAHKKSVTMRL